MTAPRWRERRSERATAVLMATSHCIIFHTVNMASTCRGLQKFRTGSRRCVLTPLPPPPPSVSHEQVLRGDVHSKVCAHFCSIHDDNETNPIQETLHSSKVANKSLRLSSSGSAPKGSSCRFLRQHANTLMMIHLSITN